ncbi:hypothetical protein CDAR_583291 [Caerostris darwini]|uniref:Uncharacterized protein n=1 Tax=Caerostris darwini TaxID=1538125 RepID=A0AAV4QKF0_9ARAC|nr:hypothetical protein CDAR_583291 [Caerostris darwini]
MLPQRGNHPTAQGFEYLRDFAKQQHRRVNHRDLINGEFLHCCLPPAQLSTPPCHRSLPFPAPKGPCYHGNSPGEPGSYTLRGAVLGLARAIMQVFMVSIACIHACLCNVQRY